MKCRWDAMAAGEKRAKGGSPRSARKRFGVRSLAPKLTGHRRLEHPADPTMSSVEEVAELLGFLADRRDNVRALLSPPL